MSRASLPRAIVIAAALVLAVIFSSGARAATAGNSSGGRLGAAMLDTDDLPPGFQPNAPMTGPLDAQVRKVPAGTPDTAPPDSLAANAAGGATGVLVGYLLGADAIAYLRNPLRRKHGQSRSTRPQAEPGVVDVTERFTLRRFDSFEEVLVRHLSRYGPVIAVNPPGTRLAPLGAARETIDSADWQPAVAGWMAQARLIVFAAPPNQVNRGLQWELQTVAAHGYWDKTLVAVPPVRADQLQYRWREFRNAAAGLWPFTVPGPVESPGALVLAFRNGRWDAITADRRSEWSYSAALERALGDPAPPAQSPPVRAPRARAAR